MPEAAKDILDALERIQDDNPLSNLRHALNTVIDATEKELSVIDETVEILDALENILYPRSVTIYMGPGGINGNGLTWSQRCNTIQEALAKARIGDKIVIGAGTYKETIVV